MISRLHGFVLMAFGLDAFSASAIIAKQADSSSQRLMRSPEDDGCCYSIGYGAMMVPCCLSTKQTKEELCKNPDGFVGGEKAWNATGCPRNAAEASTWLQAKS